MNKSRKMHKIILLRRKNILSKGDLQNTISEIMIPFIEAPNVLGDSATQKVNKRKNEPHSCDAFFLEALDAHRQLFSHHAAVPSCSLRLFFAQYIMF